MSISIVMSAGITGAAPDTWAGSAVVVRPRRMKDSSNMEQNPAKKPKDQPDIPPFNNLIYIIQNPSSH